MECEEEEPMESSTLSPSPSTHPQYPRQLGLSSEASCSSPAPTQPQSEAAAVGVYRSPCSPQISLAQYNAQAGDYTQQALRELKASPDYKKHIQRCRRLPKFEDKLKPCEMDYCCALYSCGVSWYDGEWSQGCPECGEGAMQLPCPICKGRCGRVWRRDVEMVSQPVTSYPAVYSRSVCVCVQSHSMSSAHWNGECGHKEAAAMLKDMLQLASIMDAMEELQT